MKMLFVAAALCIGVALPAMAQTTPESCVAANRARDDFIRHSGGNPLDIFRSEGAGQVRAERQSNDQNRLNALARLCLGDLVADGRYDDAATAATRFGLFQDAVSLQAAAKREKGVQ